MSFVQIMILDGESCGAGARTPAQTLYEGVIMPRNYKRKFTDIELTAFKRRPKPVKTHCKRGHLRIPENLVGRGCKLCMKQWNVEHPEERRKIAREHSRRYRMQKLYNLTEEQYQEMFEKQNGLCALPSCGQPATDIDHCHERSQTRGLMCNRHNLALGLFGDSPNLLHEAAVYLETFNGKQ